MNIENFIELRYEIPEEFIKHIFKEGGGKVIE